MNMEIMPGSVLAQDKPLYNPKRLGELLQQAKGNRTIQQYAEDVGLNRNLVGALLNGKSEKPPSKTSIYKLMDRTKAKPQNGVLLNQVLRAAGYETIAPTEGASHQVGIPLALASVAPTRFSDVDSPSRPMSMFLDLLIKEHIGSAFDIHFRSGWFEIADAETQRRETYVGISAFCGNEGNVESVKVLVKALLIDALMARDSEKPPKDRFFFILTNQERIYDFARSLPNFGKAMAVLMSNGAAFFKSAPIGGENDSGALNWLPTDELSE